MRGGIAHQHVARWRDHAAEEACDSHCRHQHNRGQCHERNDKDDCRIQSEADRCDLTVTLSAVGEEAAGQHTDGAGAKECRQRDIGCRERTAIAIHQGDDAEIGDPGIRQTEQREEDRKHDDCRRHHVDARSARAGRSGFGCSGIRRVGDHEQYGNERPDRAGHDQRAVPANGGDKRNHDGRRDGAAEKSGEGMDRECAAHARLVHMCGEDGIVGGMVDAVGEAEQRGARDQPGIADVKTEHDQRKTAHAEAADQDIAGTDAVDQITDRRLRKTGNDREHRQRKAEFDKADAELLLQEREQHRQHQQMEMTDPVRDGDHAEGAQRAVRCCPVGCRLICGGRNVDHRAHPLRFIVMTPTGYALSNGTICCLSIGAAA